MDLFSFFCNGLKYSALSSISKCRAHLSPVVPLHPWWRSLPSLKELSRVCLQSICVYGSSQWSKWPIRNAVCLTVSRSQPEPPTVAFPQHPPFPTPPSSILQICMWACRLVILFVVCIALCIWAFYFILFVSICLCMDIVCWICLGAFFVFHEML